MKPEVILLMESSLDGKLHPSRWTVSPDGDKKRWSSLYERTHEALAGDAWIVGRVTMQEISKATAHPPATVPAVARPLHVANREAKTFAIALDPAGRVHFSGGSVGGDHAIALLGRDVPDSHLAELAGDGVSYIVAEGADIDLGAMLETLNRAFGIKRLLLEGGGAINGSFLAAGLVDEAHILMGPAFDGDVGQQGIVAFPGGLQGKCTLSFRGATPLEHGMVHLRYAVSPASSSGSRS
jgi:riboflavin biosynthesis pyrimidine reductase